MLNVFVFIICHGIKGTINLLIAHESCTPEDIIFPSETLILDLMEEDRENEAFKEAFYLWFLCS